MRDTVYDGSEPYVFISYSHKDDYEIREVTKLLRYSGVRFWYDEDLALGEDWNKAIATHLRNASVCLLLLSQNSAASEYVMNELNFAISYRIPVHILMLQDFTVPLELELMTGRVQRIQMTGNYERKLLESLPIEVHEFEDGPETLELAAEYHHPIFEQGQLCSERQGTKTYTGKHMTLNYPCSIQVDILKEANEDTGRLVAVAAGNIAHPLFPVIYDIVVKNGVARTYLEYCDVVYLDEYIQEHVLTEEKILEWIMLVVDGMEYLYKRNWTLQDFSRGSLVVTHGERLKILRLQNVYYGLVKLKEETKRYYFENILQEIAVLLTTLCTGSTPLLPLRIIQNDAYSRSFLDTINLVVQKCTREYGRTAYTDFQQIIRDLRKKRLTFSDRRYLSARKAKLQKYDNERARRNEIFADPELRYERLIATNNHRSIEEEFGFDGTALLPFSGADYGLHGINDGQVQIRILIPSSGQVFEFRKDCIIVGKDASRCDWVCTQPSISRLHLRISRTRDGAYELTDLNSTNGTYISGTTSCRLAASEPVEVLDGEDIMIGDLHFKLIPTS